MSLFNDIYSAVERQFFYSLTLKIVGNIGFLTLIFWLAMFASYPAEGGAGHSWWWIFPTEYLPFSFSQNSFWEYLL